MEKCSFQSFWGLPYQIVQDGFPCSIHFPSEKQLQGRICLDQGQEQSQRQQNWTNFGRHKSWHQSWLTWFQLWSSDHWGLTCSICENDGSLDRNAISSMMSWCPFPIGWLVGKQRGLKKPLSQQVNDDSHLVHQHEIAHLFRVARRICGFPQTLSQIQRGCFYVAISWVFPRVRRNQESHDAQKDGNRCPTWSGVQGCPGYIN